jgi:hypothetical protein
MASGDVALLRRPLSGCKHNVPDDCSTANDDSRRSAIRRGRLNARLLLSVRRFDFFAQWELRRSLRYGHVVSIATIATHRDHLGVTVDVPARHFPSLAHVIGPMIRETDLMGALPNGQLGVIFCETDYSLAARAVDRFADELTHTLFPFPAGFVIGVASCPTDGVHVEGLLAHALSHPIKNIRSSSSPQSV